MRAAGRGMRRAGSVLAQVDQPSQAPGERETPGTLVGRLIHGVDVLAFGHGRLVLREPRIAVRRFVAGEASGDAVGHRA